MNIRSLSNQIFIESIKPKEAKKAFESSADRDPQQGNEFSSQDKQESFSEEEKQKALEYLENHPGVKNNHLSVSLEKHNEVMLVVIKDLKGEIVRRMGVSDLIHNYRAAQKSNIESSKGGLLNKAS